MTGKLLDNSITYYHNKYGVCKQVLGTFPAYTTEIVPASTQKAVMVLKADLMPNVAPLHIEGLKTIRKISQQTYSDTRFYFVLSERSYKGKKFFVKEKIGYPRMNRVGIFFSLNSEGPWLTDKDIFLKKAFSE